jgi:FAD/FMN-containing dehydrogenase
MKNKYESWGRYPSVKHKEVIHITKREDIPPLEGLSSPVLAYGMGRSYGDCCLNEGGNLIDTTGMSGLVAFDKEQGIIRCEAGLDLAEILERIVPHGWFLPAVPGTKFVTVGGAIANDIHGKNHHRAGTFGCHVQQFQLLRSDGTMPLCSPERNYDLYRATIGGLGLTGLILWADIQLKPIKSPFIKMESIRFNNFDEFFEISEIANKEYEYTVSWIDCMTKGYKLGRGIFICGNHADPEQDQPSVPINQQKISLSFNAPNMLLNKVTVKLFNLFYYYKGLRKHNSSTVHYNPFFFPLDSILNWNRIYGKHGFFQYQCVVPYGDDHRAIRKLLEMIACSENASFLSVLKTFGDVESPGMLSFPRSGVTLAMDIANRGNNTLRLFNELDEIVLNAGGALYPCKDARMPQKMFEASFPKLKEYREYVDDKFSSSLWRRVNG